MKKTRAIFSMLLSAVMLAAAALPALAAEAPAAEYGGYFHKANTGETRTGTNGFTGTQDSLFGKALTYKFENKDGAQNNLSVYFDDLTAPAGTKYFAFWFGQEFEKTGEVSEVQSSEWFLQQKFTVQFRDGASSESLTSVASYNGGAKGEKGTIYTVSTDDGTVRSIDINDLATTKAPGDSFNWGNFKNGYILFPVNLVSGSEVFENETVIDFRIRMHDGSAYFNDKGERLATSNAGISPNTRIFIDNVGFITDLDAFLADIGTAGEPDAKGLTTYAGSTVAYKMGYMAANGFDSQPAAIMTNGTVNVSWPKAAAAEQYIVNIYSKSGRLVSSEAVTGLSHEVSGLAESGYDIQVLALEGGKITAVSPVESVGALAGYYKIVNDGSDKSDVSAQGMNLTVEDNSPDGSAITGRTVLGQTSGLVTDQQFVQIIYKNIKVPDDAEAMVFWFGQEFEKRSDTSKIQDENAKLLPKFAFTWRAGGSNGGFSSQNVNSAMYQISTDDGIAYSASFGSNINGTPNKDSNWVTFKNGYVVVPFSLFARDGFGGNETVDFRIEITGASSGNGNLKYMDAEGNIMDMGKVSGNTVITFDNFGFITDMSAFAADLGDKDKDLQKGKTVYSNASAAYKMGYMGPTGDTLTAEAVHADNTVSVSWNEAAGAASYDVTLYNDGVSLETARVGTTSHSFAMPKLGYTVQVIARDADGKILEISAPAAVKDGELTGDVNGDYTADIKDLIRLKKIAAGMAEETPAADIDGSGNIDSADLILLRRLLMGV